MFLKHGNDKKKKEIITSMRGALLKCDNGQAKNKVRCKKFEVGDPKFLFHLIILKQLPYDPAPLHTQR